MHLLAFTGQADVQGVVGRGLEVLGGLATVVLAGIYASHGFHWMTGGQEGKAAAKAGVKETTKGYGLVMLATVVATIIGFIISGH